MLARALAFALVMIVGQVAFAQPAPPARPPVDDALDRRFRAEVEAASTEAVKAYDEGNAARDRMELDRAAIAYTRAALLAPKVDHPRRRLCTTYVALDRLVAAVPACEQALALVPGSPYDKSALAWALATRAGAGDLDRAERLAAEATDALPDDPTMWQIRCQVLTARADVASLRACVERLLPLDPDGVPTNLLASLVAIEDRDFARARARLEHAKAHGLDPETYERVDGELLRRAVAAPDPGLDVSIPDWAGTAGYVAACIVGGWLVVLTLLLAAGYVLSRLTLRTVERAAVTAADGAGSPRERRLRRIYRAVLLLSGVYFYLSMPLMLAAILGLAVGAIVVFLAIGVIPVGLVVMLALVVGATVVALVRSVFVAVDREPPGAAVDPGTHPALRLLLDDVARQIGTRPVDVAYLTPGTDMAVTERDGVWTSLRGKRTERSLIMGVGLFEGMTQLQLRAILAHEYGHFRNADTAGGGLALAARRSLFALILRLARSGAARPWNPAWWFVRGFARMYLVISQGASRLQEVLADRWAVHAYGSDAFIAGYRHIVARDVAFGRGVDATIQDAIERRRALPNLYDHVVEPTADAALTTEIETAMAREPTPYDSHPSPRQRLAWAAQLAVTRAPQPDDDAPVWALFADRDEVERAMTATVRERIAEAHGIQIADRDPDPASAGAAADRGPSSADPAAPPA